LLISNDFAHHFSPGIGAAPPNAPRIYPLCLRNWLPQDTDPLAFGGQEIDPDDEQHMRGAIRATMTEYYETANEALKSHLRNALQWLLNGGHEQTFPGSAGSGAMLTGFQIMACDSSLPMPADPKDLFVWIWREVFGNDTPWEIENFSATDYVHIDVLAFLSSLDHVGNPGL
jgi:hypothetical protein